MYPRILAGLVSIILGILISAERAGLSDPALWISLVIGLAIAIPFNFELMWLLLPSKKEDNILANKLITRIKAYDVNSPDHDPNWTADGVLSTIFGQGTYSYRENSQLCINGHTFYHPKFPAVIANLERRVKARKHQDILDKINKAC